MSDELKRLYFREVRTSFVFRGNFALFLEHAEKLRELGFEIDVPNHNATDPLSVSEIMRLDLIHLQLTEHTLQKLPPDCRKIGDVYHNLATVVAHQTMDPAACEELLERFQACSLIIPDCLKI